MEETIKREPQLLKLKEDNLSLVESALEIRYSSLKLGKLPLEFSTLKNLDNSTLVKTFGATGIKIDGMGLNECHGKIVEINKRKFFEIKNRELKLGIEIELRLDGSFNPILNNYYYKVYQTNNLKRFLFNIRFLREIFQGKSMELLGKLLTGRISFENRIEKMKMDLLEEEILKLEEIKKDRLLQKDNNLYSLSLLLLEKRNSQLDSWVNLKMDLDTMEKIIPGDNLVIERIHELKGNDYNLKEIINLDLPIEEKEIREKKLEVYRKMCKITTERIPKK